MAEPKYLTDFIKAVYPEYTELARVGTKEESILKDATTIIIQQREQIKEWKGALECIRKEANVSQTASKNVMCCQFERIEEIVYAALAKARGE